MKKQDYELKNEKISSAFLALKKRHPERLKKRLNLSWSNWNFGTEELAAGARRLEAAGIRYIELKGNHYGDDIGYRADETLKVLNDHGITVAGVCGHFGPDNDLSSNRPVKRQAAIDYIKREVAFLEAVGGGYLLVVPGAAGRSEPSDRMEFERSAATLRLVADLFVRHDIKAAIEPVRADEVSLVHTIADARAYIEAVDHPGVAHMAGDLYHMQAGESHIGEAILDAGEMLTNLHMADSNRRALGDGSLDLDTVIRALYLIGHNSDGRFVTPEPLPAGTNLYTASHAATPAGVLDELVTRSVTCFREREEALLA